MMRSLWTAASGMTSQQTNVDVIANNLANVNTTGYKSQSAQFKTLLYQTIQAKTTSANGETKPVGAQVGLGVRNSSMTSNFTNGTITDTGVDTNFAIEGQGFFQVLDNDGETYFTRDGAFNWAKSEAGVMLATSDGLPILDTNGQAIDLPSDTYDIDNITIDSYGNLCYPDETNNPQPIGIQMGIVQFANPGGLERVSSSNYKVTDASGEAVLEVENTNLKQSKIRQSALEASNVNVADEMVDLIIAQRAYEMNSKAIQASDSMLQTANNLRN